MEKRKTDILVIGMGGAAQMAALNAFDANPDLNILIVTKHSRERVAAAAWFRADSTWC